jgi:hypothetical protein
MSTQSFKNTIFEIPAIIQIKFRGIFSTYVREGQTDAVSPTGGPLVVVILCAFWGLL